MKKEVEARLDQNLQALYLKNKSKEICPGIFKGCTDHVSSSSNAFIWDKNMELGEQYKARLEPTKKHKGLSLAEI